MRRLMRNAKRFLRRLVGVNKKAALYVCYYIRMRLRRLTSYRKITDRSLRKRKKLCPVQQQLTAANARAYCDFFHKAPRFRQTRWEAFSSSQSENIRHGGSRLQGAVL